MESKDRNRQDEQYYHGFGLIGQKVINEQTSKCQVVYGEVKEGGSISCVYSFLLIR